ncbi:MAG: prolyl-tRNA editing enzyme YbaK/EbsC (Cys-tRNA(Pro) deacylase) [Candidatus Aldehydirespiratoraceae bacterium]|jgi:prolyl-tRNA editing enzyme YbaK/EbsC (Cys-tRNA(Pro) deacylase)
MAKSDAIERFIRAAAEVGITVEPVRYPDGTRTAADAAAAIGCDVAQIAKSLIVIGPDGPVLALTAGHHRMDLDRLGEILGGPVVMSDAETARAATGFAIGGTPPFGHPGPIPTLLDPSLLTHEIVYGAAGTPDSCFPIAPADLKRVTNAAISDFVIDT